MRRTSTFKKISIVLALTLVCVTTFSYSGKVFAVDTQSYTSLAPITTSGTQDLTNCTGSGCLTSYLQNLFLIGVALSAAMAVFMIVLGGIQYMSTDAITGKKDGKTRIEQALFGLMLVILCYIILATINPNLVILNFNPGNATNSTATTP